MDTSMIIERGNDFDDTTLVEGDTLECLETSEAGWWTVGKVYEVKQRHGGPQVLDDEGDWHDYARDVKFRKVPKVGPGFIFEEETRFDDTNLQPGTRLECVRTSFPEWWHVGKTYVLSEERSLVDEDNFAWNHMASAAFRKVSQDTPKALPELKAAEGDYVLCVASNNTTIYVSGGVYLVNDKGQLLNGECRWAGIFGTFVNLGKPVEGHALTYVEGAAYMCVQWDEWHDADTRYLTVTGSEDSDGDFKLDNDKFPCDAKFVRIPNEYLEASQETSAPDITWDERFDASGVQEGDILECTDSRNTNWWTVGKSYTAVTCFDDVGLRDDEEDFWPNVDVAQFRKVPKAPVKTLQALHDLITLKSGDTVRCMSTDYPRLYAEGSSYMVSFNDIGRPVLQEMYTGEGASWELVERASAPQEPSSDLMTFDEVPELPPHDRGCVVADPKAAFGSAKPGFSSIPPVALLNLGKAMENGRDKYGHMNWRKTPVETLTYVDAGFRHLAVYLDGENSDPDSGLHPLAHVMACCAIVLDAEAQGTLVDNRPTPGKCREVIVEFTAN